MKTVARMELKTGMELGEHVYTYQGTILFKEGTILDAQMIAALARYSIMCVSIKDASDYATTRFEKIRLSPAFKEFESVYHNNLNAYKYMTDDFVSNSIMYNISYLLQIHNNIYACAKTGEQLLDMLYYMLPSEDDLTYAHCLNAALISKVFAVWLGLSKEDSELFTLCGFFYDIGKLKLPNSLLWTPGRLSNDEYTKMQNHTLLGYEMLRHKKINEHILNSTIMHHERCDASGYPNHLTDDKIDIFAKYIAIVDSYEAMTSARTYRPSLHPFEVIQSFQNSGLERYGTAIITPILEHIAQAQVGRQIELSNGSPADIILIDKNNLCRPLVRLAAEGTIVDLKASPDLTIKAFL